MSAEWDAEYKRVLASPGWRKLRLAVIEAQHWRCRDCGAFAGVVASSLELHHLHYRTLGRETVADVVALCKTCHSNADIERAKRGRVSAANALWSARLNGWADAVGYAYVDDSVEAEFEDWLSRRDEM